MKQKIFSDKKKKPLWWQKSPYLTSDVLQVYDHDT